MHQERLITQQADSKRSNLRRHRNRKRSKRREIYCPEHGCYLDSVSPKRTLYADKPEHLRQKGVSRKNALMLIAQETTVALEGEWLEAFWCECCQETKWYHVFRESSGAYSLSVAPRELWQQAQGVIHPYGNPSVGEFTRRSACMVGYQGMKQFQFIK
ncbi:hypothetical protein QGP82_22000 [Leptothoe sp. LEGE 181152]|nr:hypothetical protein [Leptothoe sp. LEGE 181152]